MKIRIMLATFAAAGFVLAADTALPPVNKSGGKPLMEALAARQSNRTFSAKTLPAQTLADLLWAANGVNRPESGKRTAPSARDRREIDVYALTKDGAFLYQPEEHSLKLVNPDDLRATSGTHEFAHEAPVTLVLVVNRKRQNMGGRGNAMAERLAAIDAGIVSQNISLFAASAKLNSVVLATFSARALHTSLKLDEESEAFLAQPVGFPKE